MIIIVNPIGMMIDLVDTLVRLLLYIKTVFRCLIWCSQAVTLHVWVTVILGINVKDILEKYFLEGNLEPVKTLNATTEPLCFLSKLHYSFVFLIFLTIEITDDDVYVW